MLCRWLCPDTSTGASSGVAVCLCSLGKKLAILATAKALTVRIVLGRTDIIQILRHGEAKMLRFIDLRSKTFDGSNESVNEASKRSA